MSTPLTVLIGTERSRSLATSALPDAPVRDVRPARRERPRRQAARLLAASALRRAATRNEPAAC